MTPERWRRITAVFDAALTHDLDTRDAFIREQCRDDDALRREVECLLSAHRGAEDLDSVSWFEPRRLPIGSSVGVYRVDALLGVGGMGEVYRARDTSLDRDVALKVLPQLFAASADRALRLEREARILASLNHPNVAAIYEVARAGDIQALVLEFVDGEALSERLRHGAIDTSDALTYARQIVDALDAAHERGIVHRDLKPANIRIKAEGMVKVLDFGLAKALDGIGATSTLPNSSPEHGGRTRAGVVLGTAGYMSPEQARGEPVDARTDVWAFGCVLYEMLAGRPAYIGSTGEVTQAILTRDPDWDALPAATPARVQRLLMWCLEKDRKRRLRSIGDARHELDSDSIENVDAFDGSRSRDRRSTRILRGTIAALLVVVAAALFAARRFVVEPDDARVAPIRLTMPFGDPPRSSPFGVKHIAISDDGARVAYAGRDHLWVRRLDQTEPLALGRSGWCPFFSPDGEWVGLFDDETLWKVPVNGGPPVTLAESTNRPTGGSWGPDGTIVFATTEGLFQISDSGGPPRLLAKPDRGRQERLFAWPQVEPGARSVRFTIFSTQPNALGRIASLNLDSGEIRTVLEGASDARYIAPNELLYAAGTTLRIVGYDGAHERTIGDPLTLLNTPAAITRDNGAVDLAVSANGPLVYLPASNQPASGTPLPNLRTLDWIDSHGASQRIDVEPGFYNYPRVSPDGTRVALDIAQGGSRDIWVLDLSRLAMTQLTNAPGENMIPLWSADGRRVFFASNRTGDFELYSQAADGASDARLELAAPGLQAPHSFAPGGQLVVFDRRYLGVVTLGPNARLNPLLQTDGDLGPAAVVSPDGHWLAYESHESGQRAEIFLRPFPNAADRRERISTDGGRFARWALQTAVRSISSVRTAT
jgi:serine/threonine-protein kinase